MAAPPASLRLLTGLLIICGATAASPIARLLGGSHDEPRDLQECSSDGSFCACPPATEEWEDEGMDPMQGEVCPLTSPNHPTCSASTTGYPSSYTTMSDMGDVCSVGDHGHRQLLRTNRAIEPSEDLEDVVEHGAGRELGWGDWGDGDSWVWYFCGGGVDVPLTMTGWEPEIRALWTKRHLKTMIADICSGTLKKNYSISRWDSILNLGVTWIGGFALKMTAVKVGRVTRGINCYNKFAVTVSFDDHFDCDPGFGSTYWIRHKWNFHVYCRVPCATTSTTPETISSTTYTQSSTSTTSYSDTYTTLSLYSTMAP